VRIWLKRLLFAVLLLTGLYLLGVNLFLNSPLAPRAFNRRPAKFRIAWSAAWTVWPGLVQVRGLRLWGHVNSVTWTVDAERARGWINLGTLPGRTFRVTDLHAEGVRSRVLRGPEQETAEDRREAAEPDTPEDRSYKPWTLRFERITLDHIREFDFNDFRLTGDGQGAGAFWVVIRRNFRLDHSQVTMPAARLALGNDPIARGIHLEAEASLGPYAPHEHPGLEGFDFLSGTLQARGEVPDITFLESSGLVKTGHEAPGALVADLRIEQGRLAPGSRFDVTAPAVDGGSPFAIDTAVTRGPKGTLLHLGIDAKGLAAGRVPGHPPLFRAATLAVMSTTQETRLSKLFATVRDLQDRDKPPIQLPLASDVRASGVQIEAPGSRATLRATLDHASGRADLAGFLSRRIVIDGLRADGVSARLSLVKPKPAPEAGASPPWTVRIAGCRLTGIREVALGGYLLAGEAQAEATFSYLPDGTLAVRRAAFAMPDGRFDAGGETITRSLSLRVEAQVEPSILGQATGLAFLRYVSGTAGVRAPVSSLGFLGGYLKKTPWLALQGKGGLSADVRLDHGRLAPGSRIAVEASPIQATVLDSRATGRGTVTVAVAQEGGAAQTALRVHFNRFVFEDLRQKGWPDYLRGQGLLFSAVSPAALDLTGPMPDFDATLDLPDAEVPDLTVYDALLPKEGGLWIVSGRGRARLHLEASTATNKTRGTALLTSDAARVRFQNLELAGRLTLSAPLASPDLTNRRFDLKGTRLELQDVSYRNVESKNEAELPGWFAHAELSGGSIVWGTPLSLRGEGQVEMKNSGPLLTLFAERSRFLRWFNDALNVENVTARGAVRLGNGAVEVESLQASGGPLEIRSRMDFSKTRRWGDLFVRYGRLAAGIELRDGQTSIKLVHPLEWYEGQRGVWKPQAAR